MTAGLDLPAGHFASWLREFRAAQTTGAAIDVPCGDCRACCTSSYFVHVRPDEAATLARIPAGLLFPAPGAPGGHLVMGYDARGHCPIFRDGECSIYEDRPATCRAYDCRVFAAAGIDADRPAITQRARRWVFGYAAKSDRELHAAVRAAARSLRDHPERFPAGADPSNPAQVALLAAETRENLRV